MIKAEINYDIIFPFNDIDFFDLGSELIFNGRVRNIENKKKILGLFLNSFIIKFKLFDGISCS